MKWKIPASFSSLAVRNGFITHPIMLVTLPFQLMIVSECQAPLNAWMSSKKSGNLEL